MACSSNTVLMSMRRMEESVECGKNELRSRRVLAIEARMSGVQIRIPQPPDTIREIPWELRKTG